jgi:SAM-dependent methyltransferase
VTALSGPVTLALSGTQQEYRSALLAKLDNGTYRLEEVQNCLCGASDGIRISEHDRYGIPVGVVLCSACGLARTTPRLASTNLGAFYEQDYHGLHQGVREPDPDTALVRRGQGSAIHRYLVDLLPPGPIRIADVGAGTGQVLREFTAAHAAPVAGVGCEYATAFVEAGRRAGSDIRRGGAEALAGEGPFDLVILSHVVEHFPNPVTDLAAVRALGHDRSLFYVEVPGLLTIDRKPEYAYSLEQYLTLAHTWHFTFTTLAQTMWRAGFGPFRGDERVRAVFVRIAPIQPRVNPAEPIRILASLRELDSRRIRWRRLWRLARQRLSAVIKTMLPDRAVSAIRAWKSR